MTHALYDVYVVNDHGVHDVLYSVAKDYAERCAAELTDGVAVPAGQRPEPKFKQGTSVPSAGSATLTAGESILPK